MGRARTEPLSLSEVRMRLRSHKNRLWRDIQRYGALHPTPHIEAQLAEWAADYRQTFLELRAVERRLARGEH